MKHVGGSAVEGEAGPADDGIQRHRQRERCRVRAERRQHASGADLHVHRHFLVRAARAQLQAGRDRCQRRAIGERKARVQVDIAHRVAQQHGAGADLQLPKGGQSGRRRVRVDGHGSELPRCATVRQALELTVKLCRPQRAHVQRLTPAGAPEVAVTQGQPGIAGPQHVRRTAPRGRTDFDVWGSNLDAAQQMDLDLRRARCARWTRWTRWTRCGTVETDAALKRGPEPTLHRRGQKWPAEGFADAEPEHQHRDDDRHEARQPSAPAWRRKRASFERRSKLRHSLTLPRSARKRRRAAAASTVG